MDRDTQDHEPDNALFIGRDAEENPQYFYEEFAVGLPKILKHGGFFFLEIFL
jgi:methylase of polypeptide subunit release factors